MKKFNSVRYGWAPPEVICPRFDYATPEVISPRYGYATPEVISPRYGCASAPPEGGLNHYIYDSYTISRGSAPLQGGWGAKNLQGGWGAKLIIVILLTFNLLPLLSQYKGDLCIVKSEFIYQPSDVPFASCHASTIIQTGKGLLAAWFGGTAERDPDVGIWVSTFAKGQWSKPVEVANGIQHNKKRYPCWNPVLYNTGKEILLYYKVGPSPSTWWGELKTSDDSGKTWSKAYRLPEDILGPVKNKPVKLADGTLLCPSSTEDQGWRLHMEFTKDNGVTWERTDALNDRKTGAIQPSILFNKDGKLQLVCRSQVSRVLTAWSADNGRTWTELTPTTLPNPNSGIDAVTLSDGRQLIIYNHIRIGRNVLNAAISDDGIEWKAAFLIENEPKGAEFSYPAVIQTSDGMVHITYTWNRKQIKHLVVDPRKIIARPINGEDWPPSE